MKEDFKEEVSNNIEIKQYLEKTFFNNICNNIFIEKYVDKLYSLSKEEQDSIFVKIINKCNKPIYQSDNFLDKYFFDIQPYNVFMYAYAYKYGCKIDNTYIDKTLFDNPETSKLCISRYLINDKFIVSLYESYDMVLDIIDLFVYPSILHNDDIIIPLLPEEKYFVYNKSRKFYLETNNKDKVCEAIMQIWNKKLSGYIFEYTNKTFGDDIQYILEISKDGKFNNIPNKYFSGSVQTLSDFITYIMKKYEEKFA